MRTLIALALFSCISMQLQAQCTEGMNEISLLAATPTTNSMAQFETQDQDGMGTCYANATAALLEAALPGHPHISYQQLALTYGTSTHPVTEEGSRFSPFYNDTTTGQRMMVSEGGFICAAFYQAKRQNNGALCTRDSVPIERESQRQGTVMRALSSLYDNYGQMVSTSDRRIFRQQLATIVETMDIHGGPSDCIFPRTDPEPPNLKSRLEAMCVQLHTNVMANQTYLERLEQSLSEETDEEHQRELRQRIREIQRDNTQFQRQLDRIGVATTQTATQGQKGSRTIISCDLNERTQRHMTRYYRTLERQGSRALRRALNQFATDAHLQTQFSTEGQSQASLVTSYQQDLNYANQSWCQENEALSRLVDPQALQQALFSATSQCFDIALTGALGTALASLTGPSGTSLPASDLLEAMARLDDDYDDYTLGLIGPSCLRDMRALRAGTETSGSAVAIAENLHCDPLTLPKYPNLIGEDGQKREIAPQEILEQSRSAARDYLSSNLTNNRPIGVELCTDFFRNPDANTSYGMNCDLSQMHARHAMTVTGQRCVNNQIQYQLLNSWGNTCGYLISGASDPIYECDASNGSFWVPEDVLVKNSSGFAALVEREESTTSASPQLNQLNGR